jgi:hypothetical protein
MEDIEWAKIDFRIENCAIGLYLKGVKIDGLIEVSTRTDKDLARKNEIEITIKVIGKTI